MRVARWSVLVGLWLVSLSQLHAAAPPAEPASTPDPAPIRDLETLVVHGVQPGPGLWKVSKDDHVLWILGTASPLPDRIQWQSGEVEAIVARSQQVLLPPSLSFNADVGFFGMLALAPAAWKAMLNEDGAKLEDVLPPALYARWQAQKRRYLGRDGGVERKRPMIAASELYAAAIKSAGLGQKPVVWPAVQKAAKAAGIKPTSTTLKFEIDDPKAAIREFVPAASMTWPASSTSWRRSSATCRGWWSAPMPGRSVTSRRCASCAWKTPMAPACVPLPIPASPATAAMAICASAATGTG